MDLTGLIREVKDFPKPGVNFKDITPILGDPAALRASIDLLAEKCAGRDFDLIVCPEARGFIFAAPLAYKLGVGFAPVRKHGKLPYETLSSVYELEYGTDTLEIHRDAVKPGQKVLVLDDVLATGGTTLAVVDLVTRLGGDVDAAAYLIELGYMPGRAQLQGLPVISAIVLDS